MTLATDYRTGLPPATTPLTTPPAVATTVKAEGCNDTLASLLVELNRQGIRYCHWKSNVRLDVSLGGSTDLDLLVDRCHSAAFRALLEAHAIKPLSTPPARHYPAVESYLGFDRASGKLFHLHVHYQLVLGEQFIKNYRLPVEAMILDSTRMLHGVRVPTVEWELILLCVRALMKYRDRDALRDALRTFLPIRLPGLPAHIRDEFRWLMDQTSMEQVSQVLMGVSHLLPVDIVRQTLETVVSGPQKGVALFRLRQRLRGALAAYQRQNRWAATLHYARHLFMRHWLVRRIWHERRMTPQTGGLSVALVGADGAGKSTLSHELQRWLAWKLDVQLFYLGSKQPGWRTQVVDLGEYVCRRGWHALRARRGEGSRLARAAHLLYRTCTYSRHLSTAWDRYQRTLRGRRRAAAGSVVIFDRFPVDVILDGPKINALEAGRQDRLSGTFGRAEARIYDRMVAPDHLILLDVSPDVSVQRKPDHDRAVVEAKSRVIRDLAHGRRPCPTSHVIHIDANRPQDDVLRELKSTIWQIL